MISLIFGAGGQDGYYLKELLLQQQHFVIAVSRDDIFFYRDITNYGEVSNLIKKNKPDFIFHLAANSTTKHEAILENHATIATGTLNILEAVKNFSPHSKVFISGSGLQFKNENKPIKETDSFEARDAYSLSRITSVFAARYYRQLGLKVYVGYFFNHDSPRRSERHVAMKIAAAVKRIATGSIEKLHIGNTAVIKEWTYAGDIVRGILMLIVQDNIYEANISSGMGYSILDWIETCFKIIGKDYRQYVIQQPDFKAEYQQLVSDPSLIKSIGFIPHVSFKQLAEMMINEP